MKIVCISDTHGHHKEVKIPEGDILIHAGDWSYLGKSHEIESFEDWLESQPFDYKNIIVIAGNHDLCCDIDCQSLQISKIPIHEVDWQAPSLYKVRSAIFLNQESYTLSNGMKVYGEPRQPTFYNWAFNVRRDLMANVWALVPQDIDILVTHGPPKGAGDQCDDERRVGCVHQLKMIQEHPTLKYVICGHIHHSYGTYEIVKNNGDIVKVINASICDEKYYPSNDPIVIEV